MAGEAELSKLLSSMGPTVSEEEYVFISVDPHERPVLQAIPVCEFREAEGLTLIVPKWEAERSEIEYEFPCRMITLNVHSNLSAVGLLAIITKHLSEAGISVNAVSAFYHDHLFVPTTRVQEAINILAALATLQGGK